MSDFEALSLGLIALGRALDSPEAYSIALVAALPAVLAFLVAARQDRRLPPRTFLILFCGVSAAGLFFVAAMTLFLWTPGVGLAAFGQLYLWLTITGAESLLALLGLLFWRLATSHPTSAVRVPPGAAPD